ncbi:phosphonate metabolism protein/1,5-bisphosphokinase (PRPP-forming) PhnN [Qingshengfaniella alkalisoli]|uniref:Ribose 1,5-bisphosphate phosphokinase PhnN n=1 Tax=Qingshengfaniella alkalisoli TaxID=2599296 RepID=A0A5B8IAD3_9RHOB|nr:phosphonate metabolism protein/1,5-bisphosphokinase (PRPP-forming) PhnN [Qingshengfaniella alkalisoli]QDY71435.1 phosphonate metabolism protein/1,5-bisphosphokinase (PRPP-forming) PhnN [Qingshengfaniella alkalisoli]
MTWGRIIAVVGPSGVGKDSVIRRLCAVGSNLQCVRRVITRPSDAESEDFEGVSDEEFSARLAAGDFALHWRAHGLNYGVPATELAVISQGVDILVNLSRAVLHDAAESFSDMEVISLTASPATLAARLKGRGRETAEDIGRRLSRSNDDWKRTLPDHVLIHEIANDGSLDDTVRHLRARLCPSSRPFTHDAPN